jgi:hypothetical protein
MFPCPEPPHSTLNKILLQNSYVWCSTVSLVDWCLTSENNIFLSSSRIEKCKSIRISVSQMQLRGQPIVTCIILPALDSRCWRSHKNRIIKTAARRTYLWHSAGIRTHSHTYWHGTDDWATFSWQITVQQFNIFIPLRQIKNAEPVKR